MSVSNLSLNKSGLADSVHIVFNWITIWTQWVITGLFHKALLCNYLYDPFCSFIQESPFWTILFKVVQSVKCDINWEAGIWRNMCVMFGVFIRFCGQTGFNCNFSLPVLTLLIFRCPMQLAYQAHSCGNTCYACVNKIYEVGLLN